MQHASLWTYVIRKDWIICFTDRILIQVFVFILNPIFIMDPDLTPTFEKYGSGAK